jgi:hypothetical protein
MKNRLIICALLTFAAVTTYAQDQKGWKGKFEQLGETLPTPNSYRSSSGAPGVDYWQNKADYVINVELNDNNQQVTGSETITYHNNSPETLTYLWLQLDQNLLQNQGIKFKTSTNQVKDSVPTRYFAGAVEAFDYEGGYKIKSVKDAGGKDLEYKINFTMMRIELPGPLKTGGSYEFKVEWSYTEYDRMKYNERGGYEYFPEDGNYLYTLAQWYPRMCVFDDYEGWQNKQFLGDGEFTLAFGDFKVRITVPADHIVGATGWLQNPKDVLTRQQQERFETARKTFDKQTWIVTEDEARKKEKEKSKDKKTWEFHADNVRDFAWVSSRKFIWDAMAVKVGDKTPLAQSLYPKEGNPLWAQESTKAIKNTLEVYSSRTFDYPYPTAYSIHTASIGMEYPMICFNYGRPKKDGTPVSQRLKEGMVGVIVHEVGHNFFPMIVNSDERQWTWMDEGLNTFLERETTRTRYPDFDVTSGSPKGIASFMRGDKTQMRPIMASSDNQGRNFGPNGYTKPSAALTLLRETVMGPELFDAAFKEYAQRWAFKHPNPGDFFRSMEDASATDLDWFWKGWFYTTDNVDVELDEVKWYRVKSASADPESKVKAKSGDLSKDGSGEAKKNDFSAGPQEFTVINNATAREGERNSEFRNAVDDNAVRGKVEGKNIYEVSLVNKGGLVSPVIIEWTYKDGSKEIETLPAEIWRTNEVEVKKMFLKDKEVINVVVDPRLETADVNVNNNVFPKKPAANKFDQIKKNNN